MRGPRLQGPLRGRRWHSGARPRRSVPACFLAALQHGGRACVPGARRPRPPPAVAAVAADARARGRPGAESCHGPSAGRVPVSTPWPHRCLPAPLPPRCPRPRLPSRDPRPRTAWKPSTNEARRQGALRPAWRGPRALQTRPHGLAVSGGCRSRPAAALSLGPGPGAGPVSSPHLGGGGLFIRTPSADRSATWGRPRRGSAEAGVSRGSAGLPLPRPPRVWPGSVTTCPWASHTTLGALAMRSWPVGHFSTLGDYRRVAVAATDPPEGVLGPPTPTYSPELRRGCSIDGGGVSRGLKPSPGTAGSKPSLPPTPDFTPCRVPVRGHV